MVKTVTNIRITNKAILPVNTNLKTINGISLINDCNDCVNIDLGVGIPAGGSLGQVLTKQTGTDYDVNWETPTGGGGSSNADYNNIFLLGL